MFHNGNMKILLLLAFSLSNIAQAESGGPDERYPFNAGQARLIQQLAGYSSAQAPNKKNAKPQTVAEIADLSCLLPAASAIRALGATTSAEKSAAAKVVGNLRLVMGGNARLLDNVGFQFVSQLPLRKDGGCLPGHQYADGGRTLTFARRCPANSRQGALKLPTDQATIVHELGHLVANRGQFYARYNRAVPARCKISGYCTRSSGGHAHSHRNEEFAEAFSAFLLAPARLKAQCPAAYVFMKEQVYLGDTSGICKKAPLPSKAALAAAPHDIPDCRQSIPR